jgi:pimeloyl-ACP methyl ester carboxylesterase/class 3 adenylate cyclase
VPEGSPRTRYARVGDAYVAYQVFGQGPTDLVFNLGWYSHVDDQWEFPPLARFLERLGSFSRVICFDRRGHGMSDPADPGNITLEEWMEDVKAVMDAAESERAVIVGGQEAGPMALLYAATHPDRTAGLVLLATYATMRRHPDYPSGMPPAFLATAEEMLRQIFADGDNELYDLLLQAFAPGLTSKAETAIQLRRYVSHSVAPGTILRLWRNSVEVDVRHVLPLVRVPTLIVHRAGDTWARVEHGRYLGEQISGAKYVELPGEGQLVYLGDSGAFLDEIEEFVTGVRPVHEPDRVLATVLFTDIVSSTERLADAGDRKWRETLDSHNRIVRRELDRHRGRELHTAGDGFLATFDGPARAVRCATAIVDGVREIGIDVRAGLHTGEIELAGNDAAGIAVHIGKRVSDLADSGEVLVSRMVVDLVAGSGLTFVARGAQVLKGVPGEWQLYAVDR